MNHPVTVTVTRTTHRPRKGILIRLLAAIPLLLWGYVWGIAAIVAAVASWVSTLFTGRSPEFLHAFIARYIRYVTQSLGYLSMLGDRFPGFLADGPADADFSVSGPREQKRSTVGFRLILAVPIIILFDALQTVWLIVAAFGWVIVLFTEEMPVGLRNVGAWILRLQAETLAYLGLLTERYPRIDVNPPVAHAAAY